MGQQLGTLAPCSHSWKGCVGEVRAGSRLSQGLALPSAPSWSPILPGPQGSPGDMQTLPSRPAALPRKAHGCYTPLGLGAGHRALGSACRVHERLKSHLLQEAPAPQAKDVTFLSGPCWLSAPPEDFSPHGAKAKWGCLTTPLSTRGVGRGWQSTALSLLGRGDAGCWPVAVRTSHPRGTEPCSGPWHPGDPRGGTSACAFQLARLGSRERVDSNYLFAGFSGHQKPQRGVPWSPEAESSRWAPKVKELGGRCVLGWGGTPYLGTAAWPAGTLSLCGRGRQRAGG